jgi:hypothetical protein
MEIVGRWGGGGLQVVQTIFLGEKGPKWPYFEGKKNKKKKTS